MAKFKVIVKYADEGKITGEIIGFKEIECETVEEALRIAPVTADQITSEREVAPGKIYSHFVTPVN